MGFTWDSGKPTVVNMTEQHAEYLINAIIKGVAENTTSAAIEHYKQFARLEIDLNAARLELSRKDAEIASLRDHIGRITQFVTNNLTQQAHPALLPPVPVPSAPPAVLPPGWPNGTPNLYPAPVIPAPPAPPTTLYPAVIDGS